MHPPTFLQGGLVILEWRVYFTQNEDRQHDICSVDTSYSYDARTMLQNTTSPKHLSLSTWFLSLGDVSILRTTVISLTVLLGSKMT